MFNIDTLTIAEARQIAGLFPRLESYPTCPSDPWEVGACYLIRTVTMIDTGRLVRVTPHELVLDSAAWIADTGRFSDAVKKAEFNEVEPFPDGEVIIGRGSIVDAVKINVTPRSQK